jgi:hypothetical protein
VNEFARQNVAEAFRTILTDLHPEAGWSTRPVEGPDRPDSAPDTRQVGGRLTAPEDVNPLSDGESLAAA